MYYTLAMAMPPISVRLDAGVRATLERDAKAHHMGLATYLRRLAAARAQSLRKREIREESRRAGQAAQADPEVLDFVESWGAPSAWTPLE